MDCPNCQEAVEESLELQYAIGDEIVCPYCGAKLIILYDGIITGDGDELGYYYLEVKNRAK